MDWDKYFMFSMKKLAYLIVAWIVFVILHNAFYAIFGMEDALFFILAIFVVPLYFIVMVIYSLIKKFK